MATYDIDAVDSDNEDWTALMYAVYYQNLATVDSLIAHGANLD